VSQEPPRNLWYDLGEALELLASLEDARDALLATSHLTVVVSIEDQIRLLSPRLDFEPPEGDADEH